MRAFYANGSPLFFSIRISLLLLLAACCEPLLAKNYSRDWREFYSYRQGALLAESPQHLFMATRQAILRYSLTDATISRLSTVTGLSATGITAIEYSSSLGRLLVAYENGTIDLLHDQDIFSLPDLFERAKSTPIAPIIAFAEVQGHLYAASKEAFYLLDVENRRVVDSYRVWAGKSTSPATIYGVTSNGKTIYIATSEGIFTLSENFSSTRQFQRFTTIFDPVVAIAYAHRENVLYAVMSNGASAHLCKIDEAGGVLQKPINLSSHYALSAGAHGDCLLTEDEAIYEISNSFTLQERWRDPKRLLGVQIAMMTREGRLMAATSHRGLVEIVNGHTEELSPYSPDFTTAFRASLFEDQIAFVAGGYQRDGAVWREPFGFFAKKRANWTDALSQHNSTLEDAICIAPISADTPIFAVGTERSGLYIITPQGVESHYDQTNSALQVEQGGSAVRVEAIAVAPDGSWWIYNGGAKNSIVVRRPDGQWNAYPSPLGVCASSPSSILRISMRFSPSGNLFLATTTNCAILAVIAPTLFTQSNGANGFVWQSVLSYPLSLYSPVSGMDFDSSGTLWLATRTGLLYARDADKILQGVTLLFSRIVGVSPIDVNTGVNMLGATLATCVKVDQGDRLWVGTASRGLVLFDPKSKTIIRTIDRGNSPLPSNTILDIDIHDITGELYITTPKGVLSTRVDSRVESKDFSDVRIYPNPIRPDYTGDLYIDGLMRDSEVRIADAAGRLVRVLKSAGGRAVWDMRNGNGVKVRTGVYLIFLTDTKGEKTHVGKVAIVR